MKESAADKSDASTRNRSSKEKVEAIHPSRDESGSELSLLEYLVGCFNHDRHGLSNGSAAIDLNNIPVRGRKSAMLALQQTYGNRYVQHVVAHARLEEKSATETGNCQGSPNEFGPISASARKKEICAPAKLKTVALEGILQEHQLAEKSVRPFVIAIQRQEANAESGPAPESQPSEGASDDGKPSFKQPTQETLASLILAQTVLNDIKPLPPEQKSNIGQAISNSSIYFLIEERDANIYDLNRVKETVQEEVPGGVPEEVQQKKIEGLVSSIRDLNSRIKAEMSAIGIADENLITDQIKGFVEVWIDQANQIVKIMLDKSLIIIEEERLKYRTSPEEINGLKSADKDLAEFTAPMQIEIDILKQMNAEAGKTEGLEGSSAGEYYKSKKDLQCKYEELNAKIRSYSGKYPVLLHPQYSPGAFQNMTEEQISGATGEWLEESSKKINNIYHQVGNEIKAWDLPGVTTATFQTLKIAQDSILGGAVQDRITKEHSEAALEESTEKMIMFGVGVASALLIPVGGFVGILGGSALLSTSLFQLISDINKYALQADLQNATLDPEINKILSQGEPDLAAIVMDLIFLAVDLLIIGVAARKLRGPVSELKANKITSQEFIKDAETVVSTENASALAAKYASVGDLPPRIDIGAVEYDLVTSWGEVVRGTAIFDQETGQFISKIFYENGASIWEGQIEKISKNELVEMWKTSNRNAGEFRNLIETRMRKLVESPPSIVLGEVESVLSAQMSAKMSYIVRIEYKLAASEGRDLKAFAVYYRNTGQVISEVYENGVAVWEGQIGEISGSDLLKMWETSNGIESEFQSLIENRMSKMVEPPPRIVAGEVKSVLDVEGGWRQLRLPDRWYYSWIGSASEGGGLQAVAAYERETRMIFMEVREIGGFEPIWKGPIGQISDGEMAQMWQKSGGNIGELGNIMEPRVRGMVGKATDQVFLDKSSSAKGTDLLPRQLPLPGVN